MADVVICHPLRTPVGRFAGVFAPLTATELATTVLRELAARTGLGEGDVDDVILGNCTPTGEAPAIGRVAALDAGLGIGAPGIQVDRRCASGLQAILYAVMQVATGGGDLVIAGGTEAMSQAEHYALGLRDGVRGDGVMLMDRLGRARVTAGGRDHVIEGGMIETAENVAKEYGIGRAAQDEYALRSQQRAGAAQQAGRFDEEMVAVTVPPKRRGGEPTVVTTDEHPRPQTTLEELARLKPVRGRIDPEASVTAGNASGRTTAPPRASSPRARRPTGEASARCCAWSPGRPRGWPPRPWASGRYRPPPPPSTAPG